MKEIIIRKCENKDIDSILEVSELNKITNIKDTSGGFLVSGYPKEVYEEYLESTEYFYVATVDEKVVGVLLAFDDSTIKEDDIVNNIIKYSLSTEFILIKQIFVDPSYKGYGISSKLYKHLISSQSDEMSFATVIVDKPFNYASVNFHKKMGFENILQINPKADFDGEIRQRSVWYKKSKNNQNQFTQSFVRVKSVDISDTKNVMLSNLQNTTGLYKHEDNLNWTKLGMLVTFVFALCAGFSHYYEQNSITSNIVAFIIILLGFTISYLFDKKIHSGLMYMNNHKENLKIIETKLKFFNPNYEKTIAVSNKKISEKSATSNIMNIVPYISYMIWITLLVLLIIKLF